MIKLKKWLLAALISLTPAFISADDCCENYRNICNPCTNLSCFDDIWVGAEFLWWEPCINDLEFATTYDLDFTGLNVFEANGHTHFIVHDWAPGFRVRAGKENVFSDWDTEFSYTRVSGNDSATAHAPAGGVLFSSLGIVITNLSDLQIAWAKHEYTYQNFDALLGFDYCLTPCHILHPFIGIEGMWFNQVTESNIEGGILSDFDAHLRWDSDFWGVGFKAGTEYTCRVFNCLDFFGKGSFTILRGHIDSMVHQNGRSTPGDFALNLDENICVYIPGYHIQLGFNYTKCWCEKVFTLTFGWEFLDWLNTPQIKKFTGFNPTATQSRGSNFGFQGLFVGGSFQY